MTRLAVSLAAAGATLMLTAPALAADFSNSAGDDMGGPLRSGFSDDWSNSDDGDPLSFELGLRYWYSWGAQSFNIGSFAPDLKESDQTQAVEGQFRINDESSKFYAKGLGGVSFATSGSYSGLDSGTITAGHLGYIGADLGYAWLGDFKGPVSFGPFAGYMYWNDSPNASSLSAANNFTTATSASDISFDQNTGQTFLPGDSTDNNIEVNMLRLGFSGQAKLGSMFDLSGEVAAVPYAKMHGWLGSTAAGTEYYSDPPGSGTTGVQTFPGYNVASIQSSPTELDGWGYGAMVEALVGVHPTDNLTLRLGGRAWYVQGTADAHFSRAQIGNPSDSNSASPPNFDTAPSFSNQRYVTRGNPWSMFRYGLLGEISYSF